VNILKLVNKHYYWNAEKTHKALIFTIIFPTIKPTGEALTVLLGSFMARGIQNALNLWHVMSLYVVILWFFLTFWKKKNTLTAETVLAVLLSVSVCLSTFMMDGIQLGIFSQLGTIAMFFMLADFYRGRYLMYYLEAVYLYITFIMTVNSITMYVYYPRMYTTENAYYLYGLDNMTFMYTIVGCFLGLILCEIRGKRFRRRFSILYIFILGAYFYNFAGTAIVIVSALIVIMPLFKAKKLRVMNYRIVLLFYLLSFIFIVVGIQIPGILTKLLSIIGKDATFTGRTFIWSKMFAVFPKYWLMGVGALDATAVSILRFRGIGHLHNVVLEFLFKGGAVALLLFILLLISCYGNMMKYKKHPLAILLCIEMILLWLTCMFEFRLSTYTFWLIPICMYRIQDLTELCQY